MGTLARGDHAAGLVGELAKPLVHDLLVEDAVELCHRPLGVLAGPREARTLLQVQILPTRSDIPGSCLRVRRASLRRYSGMKVAVVGHVEWITFARVEQVPTAGAIAHATETWWGTGGGGAVPPSARQARGIVRPVHRVRRGRRVVARARALCVTGRTVTARKNRIATRQALCLVDQRRRAHDHHAGTPAGGARFRRSRVGPPGRRRRRLCDGRRCGRASSSPRGESDGGVDPASGRPRRVGRSSRRGGRERLGRPRALRPEVLAHAPPDLVVLYGGSGR